MQIEGSGYGNADSAALAFGKAYGNEGVTRQQEPQGALVEVSENNWGYLTPGWGPIDGRRIDFSKLYSAYKAAGFTPRAWTHGHFDDVRNFSATDFALVWGRSSETYLVNKVGEVRALNNGHLRAAAAAMRGSSLPRNLPGISQYYEAIDLPGRLVK